MRLSTIYNDFFNSEKAGGLVLIIATVVSLVLANSPAAGSYMGFWHIDISGHHLTHWINDGLMVIFFLLIGLELKRELYVGELNNFRKASLPVIGALGGMLVPAGIFLFFNLGTPYQSGAGIPMATDIAFAIGILSLLGSRVPASLKIFLTALAVIDDLGAIIIIAIFYTSSLSLTNLFLSLAVWASLLFLNKMKVKNLAPYLVGGVLMWYFMLNSGVHATIAGVLLAFAIPFGRGSQRHSPSDQLQHLLHKPVAFIILPLFALANTCIPLGGNISDIFTLSFGTGIILGLVLGKPLGILLFSFAGAKANVCSLPVELSWKNILGVGFLGGIGFTMSIFITLLAFDDASVIDTSKLAILVSSLIAGIVGYLFLKHNLVPHANKYYHGNIH